MKRDQPDGTTASEAPGPSRRPFASTSRFQLTLISIWGLSASPLFGKLPGSHFRCALTNSALP